MSTDKPEVQSVPALVALWQAHIKTEFPEVASAVTEEQRWRMIGLRKLLGNETGKVVEWALKNWSKFANEAADEAGTGVVPPTPKIAFLLKHRAVAVQLIAEQEKYEAELKAKSEADQKANAENKAKYESEKEAQILAKQKEAVYRFHPTMEQMERFAAVGKDEEDKVWAEMESEHKQKADAAWAEIEKEANAAA